MLAIFTIYVFLDSVPSYPFLPSLFNISKPFHLIIHAPEPSANLYLQTLFIGFLPCLNVFHEMLKNWKNTGQI